MASTVYDIRLNSKQFESKLSKLESRVSKFETKLKGFKLGGGIGGGSSSTGGSSSSGGGFINNASRGLSIGGLGIGGIGGAAMLGAGVGIAALGAKAVSLATDFEQTQIAFNTFLGSAEKANKLLGELDQFANFTPFTNEEVVLGARRLAAYGIESEKLVPTLGMLGDLAAGVGKDKLPNLILAFGQVRAAGRLMGSELRQITETGIPVLPALAKQLGITQGEVKKFVESGKVSFNDLQNALISLTSEGGQFNGMMNELSQSAGGKWSTLMGKFNKSLRELGMLVLPAISKVLDGLIFGLDKTVILFKMMGAAAREGYSLALQGADKVAKIFGDGLFSEEKRKEILEDENRALKDQARLRKLLFGGEKEDYKAPKLQMATDDTTSTATAKTSTGSRVSSTTSGGISGRGNVTVNIENVIGKQDIRGMATTEQIKEQVQRALQQVFTEISIAAG
jgi:tape measure domain-containing protein